jgi:hypothetical protein
MTRVLTGRIFSYKSFVLDDMCFVNISVAGFFNILMNWLGKMSTGHIVL